MKQLQLTDPTYEGSGDRASLESRRVPLERKVVLKFHHFGGFFIEYSANISLTGMFIKTESPKAPGSVFIFEIWLGDEYKLVHGLGEVVWVRHTEEGPDRLPGMGVRYLKIGEESRGVIERVIAEHVQKGGEVFDLVSGEGPAAEPAKANLVGDLLAFDENLLGSKPLQEEPQEQEEVTAAVDLPSSSSRGARGLRIALLLLGLAAVMGGTAYLWSAGLLPF